MYFIMRDVSQKLNILNGLRDPSKHAGDICDNYKTVRSMCIFEEKKYNVNRQNELGCRNLLRLHRALLFIIELFDKVCHGNFKFNLFLVGIMG